MMIDPVISISPEQGIEIKLNKKNDEQAIKPVEDSDGSGSAKLDFKKEEITNNKFKNTSSETGEIYDIKGMLTKKKPLINRKYNGDTTIDLIV